MGNDQLGFKLQMPKDHGIPFPPNVWLRWNGAEDPPMGACYIGLHDITKLSYKVPIMMRISENLNVQAGQAYRGHILIFEKSKHLNYNQ